MKNLLKKLVSASLAGTLLLTSCTSNSAVQPIENQNESTQISSLASDFIVQKAVSVTIQNPSLYGDKVKVSSSFGEFTARTKDLEKDNSESIKINTLSTQLITLASDNDVSKTPLALSIVPNPQKIKNIVLSPQTTAEALVFMHPALATPEPNLAEKVVAIIKSLPETTALAKVIESRNKEKDFLSVDSTQQTEALSKAVNSAVNRIATEFDKISSKAEPANSVQGVEINAKALQNDSANFEMKNYRKRMVSLNFMVQDKNVYSEELIAAYDLIDLTNISFGFKPSVKVAQHNTNDKVDKVEVMGVGLKDFDVFKQKWDQSDTQTKIKYAIPLGKGLISDFVSPIISIITGFNINKIYHAGILKVITALPVLEIVQSFRNKEYSKAFRSILSGTVKALLANNGALLREILLKAGVQLTEDMIKRLNMVTGIFNLSMHIVEATRTLYAYVNSKIFDYFKVEVVNGIITFKKMDDN
ncbi:MAG: hypothetical protein U0457_10280 [Candidatus Sericytochromatia bacterium]